MISPANLLKRVGVGGRMLAFVKCVCAYFVVGVGGEPPAPALAVLKVAPVLCLLAMVLLHARETTHKLSSGRGRYARRVAAGLALSALGDALLECPQRQLFVAGMAAFSAAHLAYISAFKSSPPALAVGGLCVGSSLAFLLLLRVPAGALRALVPLYALLLAGSLWRALARALHTPRQPGAVAAALGALLFFVSDGLLGYSMFGGPLPYKQVLVMTTYYAGQLGIALSALHPAQPAHPATLNSAR